MMTEPMDLLARLRASDPYDREAPSVVDTDWADELADWLVAAPTRDQQPRKVSHKRRVLALAGVCLAIASGVAVAAITRDSNLPTPDFDRPVRQETIAGYTLSLAPAVGDTNRLCLVAQSPDGPRLSGCGDKALIAVEGAQISTSGDGALRTVIGFAPGHENQPVTYGDSQSLVSSQGFFVISGNSGDALSIR